MALPISKDELIRLSKLAGMFGSAHAGERAAAALKADKLVRDLGLTWFDVLVPHQNQLAGSSIATKLTLLRDNLDRLTPWEVGFVRSLGRFGRFSPKQRAVIDRLVAKVSEERRAA
jgi:hypothetical protein